MAVGGVLSVVLARCRSMPELTTGRVGSQGGGVVRGGMRRNGVWFIVVGLVLCGHLS